MGRVVYSSLLAANMFKIVLVAALAALAVEARFLSQASQLNGKIYGGVDANIEDYPYHVSFQRFGVHGCGGSIITHNIILTAGHCTDPYIPDVTMMSVRYGTSIMHQGGTVINVAEVFQHPIFNIYTLDYDISLLKLVGTVQMSPQAEHVDLVPLYLQEGGRSAKVTGWGQIYEDGPISEQLKVVEIKEVDRDACRTVYGDQVTERMICFTDIVKDICRYDSGGPLVSRNGQIGVASWGSGCGNYRYPGVYSNIGNKDLREYIDFHVEAHGTK